MTEQKGDNEGKKFSFIPYEVDYSHHRSCYITYTNTEAHKILERGFEDSPLYNGTIESIGPRYCPSIEDKIVTFAEKEQHLLFLEPEGLNTNEFYINGFSSSLPWDIQLEALRKIKGLEKVKIFRPGYAIEYDYYPPTQLITHAGNKNDQWFVFCRTNKWTTGYEEAAAQGMMAGINAHKKVRSEDAFLLERDNSYIGVLIDDLVTKGVDEPYRMFTSRAEFRILLRQDDADERLTRISYRAGLAEKDRVDVLEEKIEKRDRLIYYLKETSIAPKDVNDKLNDLRNIRLKAKSEKCWFNRKTTGRH